MDRTYEGLDKIIQYGLITGIVDTLDAMLDEGIIKMFDPKTKKKIRKKEAKKMLKSWKEEGLNV